MKTLPRKIRMAVAASAAGTVLMTGVAASATEEVPNPPATGNKEREQHRFGPDQPHRHVPYLAQQPVNTKRGYAWAAQGQIDAYSTVYPIMKAAPERWGGAYSERDKLVVLTMESPVEARSALLAAGVDPTILEVRTGKESLADLAAAEEKALEVLEEQDLEGTITADYETGTVEVGLPEDEPTARGELAESEAETGVEAITYHAEPMKPTSRYYYDEYRAGGRIFMANGSTCTTGASWMKDGWNYLVTAGHCGRNGTAVFYRDGSGSQRKLGTVRWDSAGRSGDIAMIKIINNRNAWASLWVGGSYGNANTDRYEPISDVAMTGGRLPKGTYSTAFKTSGQTTGVTKPWHEVIGSGGTTRGSDGQVWRNLDVLKRPLGDCIRPGDSGGSLYFKGTWQGKASAVIVGIISGANHNTEQADGFCRMTTTPTQSIYQQFGGVAKRKG